MEGGERRPFFAHPSLWRRAMTRAGTGERAEVNMARGNSSGALAAYSASACAQKRRERQKGEGKRGEGKGEGEKGATEGWARAPGVSERVASSKAREGTG